MTETSHRPAIDKALKRKLASCTKLQLLTLFKHHPLRSALKRSPSSSTSTKIKTHDFFLNILTLPNELLIHILHSVYPPEAFSKSYIRKTRGTVQFWESVLRLDRIMIRVSHICARLRGVVELIMVELANAAGFMKTSWGPRESVIRMHRLYRDRAEWRWGYGVVM